jgi:DNA-binding MarR family transcriptional regulator
MLFHEVLLSELGIRAIIQILNSTTESCVVMDNTEGTTRVRELELLNVLAEDPEIRQIDLATRLGVAVGTVNWLLKRLVSKGYVKVRRIGRWRWRYLLTPRGMEEKVKLTQAYLRRSMRLFRQTRQDSRRVLAEIKEKGYHTVCVSDSLDTDLADVFKLTCLEEGIKVVEEEKDGIPCVLSDGDRIGAVWPQA